MTRAEMPWGRHGDQCPDCRIDLEASPTEVRCWRCGREVRDVDNGPLFTDLYEATTGEAP